MNRLTRISLLLCIATCCAALPLTAQQKIGTVDLRKVFDGYWKTKQADAALKERGAEMDKEHKELLAELNAGKEDYQKLLEGANDQAVSATERERRKNAAEAKLKELGEAQQTIQQFEQQARETLSTQQARMRSNILDEVKATITSKARQEGFFLVVDTAAETPNGTPIFLYASNVNDITDGVLSQLNATAPLDTSGSTSGR